MPPIDVRITLENYSSFCHLKSKFLYRLADPKYQNCHHHSSSDKGTALSGHYLVPTSLK